MDGPVLVNIMTDPNALAMPPKIEFGQMVGFAQSMYKLLINGRSQEVIDTINSNYNIYGRYFRLSGKVIIILFSYVCNHQKV